MDPKLMKLMEKKKGEEMDPARKEAKMNMLQSLRDHMSGMMGDDLKSGKMHSVEVAAPDKESLAHGLDTAKDLLADHDSNEGDEGEEDGDEDSIKPESDMGGLSSDDSDDSDKEPAEHMIEDQIDHESAEHDLSGEDIDELIELLQKKKQEMGHI